ncbi:hypothetical protein RFI_19373, partial [Reticulomyxa filosa]
KKKKKKLNEKGHEDTKQYQERCVWKYKQPPKKTMQVEWEPSKVEDKDNSKLRYAVKYKEEKGDNSDDEDENNTDEIEKLDDNEDEDDNNSDDEDDNNKKRKSNNDSSRWEKSDYISKTSILLKNLQANCKYKLQVIVEEMSRDNEVVANKDYQNKSEILHFKTPTSTFLLLHIDCII